MILARFAESMRYCEEALANARAVGDLEVEGHVTNTLGVNTAYLGDADEGLRLLWSARAIADEVGNLEDVGRAYANLLDVLRVAARYQQAADLGRESFEYLREHGLATTYGVGVLNYAGWSLYSLGRWSESLDLLEQARRYPMRLNDEVMNLCVTSSIEACSGRFEQARAHLDAIHPLISRAIDTQLLLPYAEAQAQLGLWTGQPVDALSAVLEGIDRSEPLVGGNISRYGPVYALGLRAAADVVARADDVAAAGARQSAVRLLADVERAHVEIEQHQPAHVQLAAPFRELCRAEMSRLEGRDDVENWRTAADRLATLSLGYFVAYARWRQSEATLQRDGRAADAQQKLREAAMLATDLGARPLSMAIERLARRARVELGVSPAEDANPGDLGLTAREIEVLRLVAAGKTNREIGEELFISDKTASVHVSHVLSKLGVSRRAEAAAIAARLGLGDAALPRAD